MRNNYGQPQQPTYGPSQPPNQPTYGNLNPYPYYPQMPQMPPSWGYPSEPGGSSGYYPSVPGGSTGYYPNYPSYPEVRNSSKFTYSWDPISRVARSSIFRNFSVRIALNGACSLNYFDKMFLDDCKSVF